MSFDKYVHRSPAPHLHLESFSPPGSHPPCSVLESRWWIFPSRFSSDVVTGIPWSPGPPPCDFRAASQPFIHSLNNYNNSERHWGICLSTALMLNTSMCPNFPDYEQCCENMFGRWVLSTPFSRGWLVQGNTQVEGVNFLEHAGRLPPGLWCLSVSVATPRRLRDCFANARALLFCFVFLGLLVRPCVSCF